MHYEYQVNNLFLKVQGDFNLRKVKNLQKIIDDYQEKIENLHIDLYESKLVNSEAIKFIYQLYKEKINIEIKNFSTLRFFLLTIWTNCFNLYLITH